MSRFTVHTVVSASSHIQPHPFPTHTHTKQDHLEHFMTSMMRPHHQANKERDRKKGGLQETLPRRLVFQQETTYH